MIDITIIERSTGFRVIVEDREERVAYVAPCMMDTYYDALHVARHGCEALGACIDDARITRIVKQKYNYDAIHIN